MRLSDVIWSNLRRRRGRMVLLVLGLVLGVGTVVALMAITATLQEDVANKMDQFGANVLIVPRSSSLSLSYGGLTVAAASYDVGELTLADLERIRTIKNARNISVVAPKLLSAVQIAGRPVLVAGVRFADELRLKQWWQVEEGREPTAPDEALAGRRLSTLLGLRPGTPLEIGGETFRIAGILAENGSQDDDILFIDLAAAQEAMGRPGKVSLAEVAALCSACPVEDIVAQIGEVLPQAQVTALRQAVALRMQTVGQLERFALAVSAVVVTIGGLVVLTTMLGAVAERRQEIGLFRALGFRQRHVMQIILGEVGVVSLGGGILGWLAGMGAAVILAPHVANVTTPVPWNPLLALGAVGTALAEEVGFVPALETLAQEAGRQGRLPVQVRLEGMPRRLSPTRELALYRIAQEALSNALRHAQAKQIWLTLRFDDTGVTLTVADDGVGFHPPEHPGRLTQEGHFGLLGMRERALLVGGRLHISSAPGQGTAISVHLPG